MSSVKPFQILSYILLDLILPILTILPQNTQRFCTIPATGSSSNRGRAGREPLGYTPMYSVKEPFTCFQGFSLEQIRNKFIVEFQSQTSGTGEEIFIATLC